MPRRESRVIWALFGPMSNEASDKVPADKVGKVVHMANGPTLRTPQVES